MPAGLLEKNTMRLMTAMHGVSAVCEEIMFMSGVLTITMSRDLLGGTFQSRVTLIGGCLAM